MKVTVHKAKTELSKLIAAALSGEDVIIARGKVPVVQLIPIVTSRFIVGILAGELGQGPDFFAAMPDADLDLWEGKV
jgi:antitoxin (DNA-binding transcriptional repressor) of toxin-antitoxin stability system